MTQLTISKADKTACEAVLARHRAMVVLCDGDEGLAVKLATAVAIEHAALRANEDMCGAVNVLDELKEVLQDLRDGVTEPRTDSHG